MKKILNPVPPAQQTPAGEVALQIRRIVASTWNRMRYAQEECHRLLWDHPEGINPQEILDALGTDAADLFAVGADLSELILKHDPEFPLSRVQPPVPPVFEPDGKVKLPEQAQAKNPSNPPRKH